MYKVDKRKVVRSLQEWFRSTPVARYLYTCELRHLGHRATVTQMRKHKHIYKHSQLEEHRYNIQVCCTKTSWKSATKKITCLGRSNDKHEQIQSHADTQSKARFQ